VMKISHYRIVFEQVSKRLGIRQVIHRHKIDILVAKARSKHITADAAKPIYPYFNSHCDLDSSDKVRIIKTLRIPQLGALFKSCPFREQGCRTPQNLETNRI